MSRFQKRNSELDKFHPLVSPIFIPRIRPIPQLTNRPPDLAETHMATNHTAYTEVGCCLCDLYYKYTKYCGSSEAVLTHLVRSWLMFKSLHFVFPLQLLPQLNEETEADHIDQTLQLSWQDPAQ